MTPSTKAGAAPKKPGQRGGHKPTLPPELALVTRGMRARPDEWARFFALVEIHGDLVETSKGASERTLFARMITREADGVPSDRREEFERIRRRKLAEIIASNAARAKK